MQVALRSNVPSGWVVSPRGRETNRFAGRASSCGDELEHLVARLWEWGSSGLTQRVERGTVWTVAIPARFRA